MPDSGGPWARQSAPQPKPTVPRRRLFVWFAVLAAIGAGIWLMFRLFPGAAGSSEDSAWVGYGALWLVLLSLRLFSGGPIRWGEKAKHAAIWIGIIAALGVGFTYRNELGAVTQRVRSEFSGASPVAVSPHEVVVTAEESGHFVVMGQVNGQPVRFLVDTGASDTVLSPADAKRLGVDMAGLKFDQSAETANGLGYGAAYTAERLSVGSISFSDMPMMINQAPLSNSLLGMTFLRRLESFQVRDGKLYLKSRE
jgi:aspartyl protease family protein